MLQAAAVQTNQRSIPLDLLRGWIMILMALDHASFFIAKIHPMEYWGYPLPEYPGALSFFTRYVTHLSAPGFLFLLGAGMTWYANSRRLFGWSESCIARHFAMRGATLILIQQILENPAWLIGALGAEVPIDRYGQPGMPGGGGQPFFGVGVLFALGGSMILWGVFLRLQTIIVLLVSLAAVLITQWLTPSAEQVTIQYPLVIRLLLIPGHSGHWAVIYPLIPWFGVAGLGIVFGRLLLTEQTKTYQWSVGIGILFLALFTAIQINANRTQLQYGDQICWIGFLSVTKYPPSLAFLSVTLGLNLIFLFVFSRIQTFFTKWAKPIITFGHTALFFYITHLYVYAVIGMFFPIGMTLAQMYPFWLFGLVILYPLCRWYEGIKQTKAPNSLWRIL